MSLSNTTETAALDAFLRGTDPSYRAGATQYLALFTGDPGETASLAAEANYTGYARVALTKATAWTGTASPFTNAAQQFTYNLLKYAQTSSVPGEDVDFMAFAQRYRARMTQEEDDLLLLSMVL